MAKFDVFIGRHKELELIRFWADRAGTVHYVLVDGQGGVGKSFLLQKVMQEYQNRSGFAVDYYDYAEHPPGGIRAALHLAESLGWDNFPGFRNQVAELATGKLDIADPRLFQLETEVFRTNLHELNGFLLHTRLIRITDTMEAVLLLDPSREPPLFEVSDNTPNTLFIVAGRSTRNLLSSFQMKYGHENVTFVYLEGFNPVEANEYFAAVDQDGLIPDDLRSKLHLLTQGRPVLLSLATEWIYHQVPPPEMDQHSLDELASLSSADFEALYRRFEFELVDRVRGLQSPLDQAILYLAHIGKRCDVRLLTVMLGISVEEAQNVVQQLAALPFVKYHMTTIGPTCKLHDEMNQLVNVHVWPYLDPTGQVRQKLTRKVIERYYVPRLSELTEQVKAGLKPSRGPISRATVSSTEWELWLLEAECLHYHLQVSKAQGLAYFNERFSDAQRNNHLIRIQFLLSEMEGTGETQVRDAVDLRRAEFLCQRGQSQQARAVCERILAKPDASLDSQIGAHATLGLIAASSQPKQARVIMKSPCDLHKKRKPLDLWASCITI